MRSAFWMSEPRVLSWVVGGAFAVGHTGPTQLFSENRLVRSPMPMVVLVPSVMSANRTLLLR